MDQDAISVDAPTPSELGEIQTEGICHVEDDEIQTKEQLNDPFGEKGPSYERGQIVHGKEAHSGGSTNPNGSLSQADSGNEDNV